MILKRHTEDRNYCGMKILWREKSAITTFLPMLSLMRKRQESSPERCLLSSWEISAQIRYFFCPKRRFGAIFRKLLKERQSRRLMPSGKEPVWDGRRIRKRLPAGGFCRRRMHMDIKTAVSTPKPYGKWVRCNSTAEMPIIRILQSAPASASDIQTIKKMNGPQISEDRFSASGTMVCR